MPLFEWICRTFIDVKTRHFRIKVERSLIHSVPSRGVRCAYALPGVETALHRKLCWTDAGYGEGIDFVFFFLFFISFASADLLLVEVAVWFAPCCYLSEWCFYR